MKARHLHRAGNKNTLLLVVFLLFAFFNLYASEESYEIFIKKSLVDSFIIREADGKAATSSVTIDKPANFSIPIAIADIYLFTEQNRISFQISSVNSFKMKTAAGAAIPYDLYAQTELEPDPIHITGTNNSFLAKVDTIPFEDDFVFSLMLLLDEDAFDSGGAGVYTDTLQLVMVAV